jgi:acetyltransferase-like isoleucine patch superfamily enzyme
MFSFYQIIKSFKPRFLGWIFRLLCLGSKRVVVGKNFCCNSFPDLTVDKDCQLSIGDNVLLRRGVEIRVHSSSKVHIGRNCRIDRGVRLLSANHSEIVIGDGTRIGLYTVFNGGDSIHIGEKVLISGFVYLQTSMHNHNKEKKVQDQGYSHKPVKLQDDAWLGAHVVVLPGCIIGRGSVVGSNAVVTRDVVDFSIVAGVPAKVINSRK